MKKIDLQAISGLPVWIDDEQRLCFGEAIIVEESRVRRLDALTGVYLDHAACQGDTIAYWMDNGITRREDQAALDGLPTRYEFTYFPDMRIGREYVKTLGHIHHPQPCSGIDYPEICEVLFGTAHFLFQKLDPTGPEASEVFTIEVKPGEKIIIPPGYDHLTINPGPGPMLFSDVVSRDVSGDYSRLSQAGGGAYFEEEEKGEPRFIPNPRYRSSAPLRKGRPKDFPDLGLVFGRPLYQAYLETSGRQWEFLIHPEAFTVQFPDLDSLFEFAHER